MDPTPTPQDSPGPDPESPPTRHALAAFAVCAAVGLGLSLLPHLAWWSVLGRPVWFADYDDLDLYTATGAQAYDNHPSYLGDPPHPTGVSGMYPWVQLVPGVLLAKGLGLGPLGVNLVWRAIAGLGMALGWYLYVRHDVRRPWAAAGLTCLLLSNCGLFAGVPLVKHFWLVGRFALGRWGTSLDSVPLLCFQWRIITPGLNFPYLALHLWLFARARERPGWRPLVLSGASFGLLFYAYFYYWTAAGLALVLVMALDGPSRRVAFHTGWVGGLIGLPSVVSNALLKRSSPPDWLQRSDKFLPIPRFTELTVHPAWVLLAVALVWVWLRRRDLAHLWSVAAAGALLVNHQVVSGLQIENFHWVYVWGPCLSLLLLLLVWDELWGRPAWRRPLAWGLALACVAQVGSCAWLRWVEGTESYLTRTIMTDYQRYRDQRGGAGAPRLSANATIAGDPSFVELAAVLENVRPLDHYSVLFSPRVDNAEWDDRVALNAYLLGQGRDDFRAEQPALLADPGQRTAGRGGVWGPWKRDPARLAERLAGRLAGYDAARRDPAAALDRFRVRYVAVPAGHDPPPEAPGVAWALLQRGPTWDLYRRETPGPSAGPALRPARRSAGPSRGGS